MKGLLIVLALCGGAATGSAPSRVVAAAAPTPPTQAEIEAAYALGYNDGYSQAGYDNPYTSEILKFAYSWGWIEGVEIYTY